MNLINDVRLKRFHVKSEENFVKSGESLREITSVENHVKSSQLKFTWNHSKWKLREITSKKNVNQLKWFHVKSDDNFEKLGNNFVKLGEIFREITFSEKIREITSRFNTNHMIMKWIPSDLTWNLWKISWNQGKTYVKSF